jgi:catechol 2,3-dioxygenase-like lactoylglutathione lyase family enzyme
MKLRTGDPWMPGPAYARTLSGVTINLLVRDVARSLRFQREVLGAEVVYDDPDFAVVRAYGGEWMLHADHAFERHPSAVPVLAGGERGIGVEIRVHGCDPDRAEAACRRLGWEVIDAPRDKGHGLREAYLRDPDGYVWVPDVPLA